MTEKTREPDLIEKIAKSLPLDVRAEFLNEMRYLRSLPENDELLRILRSMMFLTLLTEQVPRQILTEREKVETSCNAVVTTAKRLEKTGSEYYKQLDSRLIRLPVDIATGINPKAIVECINGDLKKQFDISTIPIVAKELAANADTIKKSTKEYTHATEVLIDQFRSASEKAREAIWNINHAVSSAAKTAEKSIDAFSVSLDKSYNRMINVLVGLSLIAGAAAATAIIVRFWL
jgi:hypothetical protein